jgi:hypothetical protein
MSLFRGHTIIFRRDSRTVGKQGENTTFLGPCGLCLLFDLEDGYSNEITQPHIPEDKGLLNGDFLSPCREKQKS